MALEVFLNINSIIECRQKELSMPLEKFTALIEGFKKKTKRTFILPETL